LARYADDGEIGHDDWLHRPGFMLSWRRKSSVRQERPSLAVETIMLIEEMLQQSNVAGETYPGGAVETGDTGKQRNRQEVHAAPTGLPPLKRGQSWATFIANHAGET
jgi:hypothetical protein